SRAAARANNRKRHPLKRFGLERAEYERLLAGFGSTCGICSNPETQRHKKTLSLDHCHKTGVIRGALCSRCNTLLGWAGDSPELLEKAAKYLRKARRKT